ncbi:hypothetical protein [Candidatus Tisiphia endosymbiont of Hybos culiciformis]|uniref:hypothetical protein n=1 Tax=Candidatus Tisiphia endosymbiont of Hybos culiciformis TaxID=3139331 RepID=UPI003CCA7B92
MLSAIPQKKFYKTPPYTPFCATDTPRVILWAIFAKKCKKVTKTAKNLTKIATNAEFSITPSSSEECGAVATRCITLIFPKFKKPSVMRIKS